MQNLQITTAWLWPAETSKFKPLFVDKKTEMSTRIIGIRKCKEYAYRRCMTSKSITKHKGSAAKPQGKNIPS